MTGSKNAPAPEAPDSRVPELDAGVRSALPRLEPEALEVFFEHYFDRVYAYLRRLVGEDHLAEDLVQDVFLHVHRSFPRYDPGRPLSPWVFTIAMNKVRDHWRSRQSQEDRRVGSVDDEGFRASLVAEVPSPSRRLEGLEANSAVEAAIADLPPLLRETFVLRFYEEFSFEEIGSLVDRNETAVRKRYSRALGELRARLEQFS